MAHDTKICAEIENDIARLQCYDDANPADDSKSETSAQNTGFALPSHANWERSEEKDAISDRSNITYFGLPKKEQRNKFGRLKSVFLQLRCNDNTTSVVLYFDDYQISDSIKLAIRVDELESTQTSWSVASNRKAVGLWNGEKSIPFIKSLIGSKTLAIRAFLDDSTDTYSFDTSKVSEYALDIADACNWKLN